MKPSLLASTGLILTAGYPAIAVAQSAQRFLVQTHSFNSPLSTDNSASHWLISSYVDTSDAEGLKLTNGTAKQQGGIWNKVPLQTDMFEVEVTFEVKVPKDSLGSEGIAIWMVSEAQSNTLPGPHASWNLFGYKNGFDGLGIFLSTTDRQGKINPSISAAVSDSSKIWDSLKHVPSNDGIYFNFRNTGPNTLRIISSANGIIGYVKAVNQAEWKVAFNLVSGRLSPGMIFGITASSHPQGAQGPVTDQILISNVSVINLDPEQNDAVIAAVRHVSERDYISRLASGESAVNDKGEVGEGLAILTRILAKHIQDSYEREEHLSRVLSNFMNSQEQLNKKNDEIHSEIRSVKADPNNLHIELRGLKEEILRQAESVQKVNNPKVDQLAARSASLEQTIRQHATFSSYLFGGFGVLVTCLGYFIWRRMKEMEKKHLL